MSCGRTIAFLLLVYSVRDSFIQRFLSLSVSDGKSLLLLAEAIIYLLERHLASGYLLNLFNGMGESSIGIYCNLITN